MDQRIVDLYDEYVHVHFDRRLFLDRAGKIVGSSAAAVALLPLLDSNHALAITVPETDSGITAQRVTFPGMKSDVFAYLAEPKTDTRRGSVVVIHAFKGLNAHVEDDARRLAKQGYAALAVDFFSPLGGTPDGDALALDMLSKLDPAESVANALAAVKWLRARPNSNGKVGAIGFCWGGGMVNQMAVHEPTLNVGVVFYGAAPKSEEVSRIKAPLLLNYADPTLNVRLGAQMPAYEKALKANGVKYELFFYTGCNHAFEDDTSQERYVKSGAQLAWNRSLDYFKRYLA